MPLTPLQLPDSFLVSCVYKIRNYSNKRWEYCLTETNTNDVFRPGHI